MSTGVIDLDSIREVSSYRIVKHGRDDIRCYRVTPNNTEEEIDEAQEVYNHSPSGFEYGYSGSGPSQLALAILYDFLKQDEKNHLLSHYSKFTREFIATLDREKNEHHIQRSEILEFLRKEERA
jgi:DNA replication protein DnaC